MIANETSLKCPKCENIALDRVSVYSTFQLKSGLVRGWRLKCPKCEITYILDEYAHEDMKDKFRNKALRSIDGAAVYLQKSLLEEKLD